MIYIDISADVNTINGMHKLDDGCVRGTKEDAIAYIEGRQHHLP